jgi:hypothetical protein
MPLLPGLLSLSLAWGAGCAGGSGAGAESRYPEKRRPPPARSASDGEVLGANRQAPEDTLEALPTNQHPAKGWVVEDGELVPEREARQRAAATEAALADCDPKAPDPASSPHGTPGSTPAASTPAASTPAASSPAASSPAASTPPGAAPASARRVKPRCPKPAAH